jgi:hypothetical protein
MPAMRQLVFLTSILIALCQYPASAAEINVHDSEEFGPAKDVDAVAATTDESVIAKEASEILLRMADFVSAAPAFTLLGETGHEVLQKNGQVLEFGSQFSLVIQRPSNALGRFNSRDGDSSITVLDGSAIWVYIAKENVYDTMPQPGDIDTSLDILARQMGIPRQLGDFLSADPAKSLLSAIKSGYYVGESMISGVMCDHLAMRSEREDVQVWIAQGDKPVPRRIVITQRQIEGQPQFWAQFSEWNFSTGLSDSSFIFSPPEGARRIHFISDMPTGDTK